MGEYLIKGGNKIGGEINISGGKNAILPILAAAVLNKNESIIHNCPRISDTFVAIDILKAIGCKVEFNESTMVLNSKYAENWEVPEEPVREMRSSIIFLGSILGRFKKVKISYPGGFCLSVEDLHFILFLYYYMIGIFFYDNIFFKVHLSKQGYTLIYRKAIHSGKKADNLKAEYRYLSKVQALQVTVSKCSCKRTKERKVKT